MSDEVADALENIGTSPNESDANGEVANVVDGLFEIARQARRIGVAIMPVAAPGRSADGGHVESLTEAVMGVDASLSRIADAIFDLAAAIRERP